MQSETNSLALKTVVGLPGEDMVYAVFLTMITLLKNPPSRFEIYPQMRLKWKPEDNRDRRSEVPDIGIGMFTPAGASPPFKLRCGVEAKRATDMMISLPTPESLKNNHELSVAFHKLYHQAQDQAKAACKNRYPFSDKIDWILLIGPYWMPVIFGPFTEAQIGVRSHKPSDSADFLESLNLRVSLHESIRPIAELYLLGTPGSSERLESILRSTDDLAKAFITSMSSDA